MEKTQIRRSIARAMAHAKGATTWDQVPGFIYQNKS